ncbi:MATN1-like protein [Mya arenaria]|uniref:MATN1-like protein n=1 Tax=Mya arenaria TaxID=6604 RepID=A0ABY7E2W5_MYAAR|nr:cartilage matrix protein-like [Mya arenaria]WAR04185.1 MATN1-like protein [Mya arenaria]
MLRMPLTGAIICLVLVQFVNSAPRNVDDVAKKVCQNKPAEIIFLMDSSSSIWYIDFAKQINFVSDMVDHFEIGPDKTRIGVGSFAYKYRPNFGLDSYDNAEDIKTAIKAIPQYLGGTYTYDALDGVRTRALDKDIVRAGVVKIVIVLTDGESYNAHKTKVAAMKLKEDAVVFAVGIGEKTDDQELRAIASEPSDEYLFHVGNYGLLDTIKEALAVTACKVELNDGEYAEVNRGPACGAERSADVMFLMEPKELGVTNTLEITEFIADLTNDFNTENGNIRVGMQTSHCGTGNVELGEYTEGEELAKAFKNTPVSSMGHMVKRLRIHSYTEENGGRDSARHMAVIFVDDALFDPEAVIKEAKRSKHQDVELFVVAIGDSVVDSELESLVSHPTDRHIIRVNSYEDLKLSKPKFLEQFCVGL